MSSSAKKSRPPAAPGPGRPKDLEKRASILDAAKRLFPVHGFDGVSMDVKASWDTHSAVTRVPRSGERARGSYALIRSSGVACEFHTVNQAQISVTQGQTTFLSA